MPVEARGHRARRRNASRAKNASMNYAILSSRAGPSLQNTRHARLDQGVSDELVTTPAAKTQRKKKKITAESWMQRQRLEYNKHSVKI